MSTTLDLLRHGEPVGGRMYRGGIDHPLTELGWRQMRDATADPAAWQHIVSSPLSRCRAFAEELAQRLGLPLDIDPRLREVGFGSWEGKTGDQLRTDDPTVLQRFYHDPIGERPEGAEALADFQARVSASIEQQLQTHAGKHILLVAHAGVIRAAVAHTLLAPLPALYRMNVDNASFTRLRVTDERPLSLIYQNRRKP